MTGRRPSWPATGHGLRTISGRRRTSSGHGPVASSSSCNPGPSPHCPNRRPTPRTPGRCPTRRGSTSGRASWNSCPTRSRRCSPTSLTARCPGRCRALMAEAVGTERHPRGRRGAAHHQRLRLLLLPQLGNVADDGQVADGGARAGPRQGAHGGGRLARIFASPLRTGDQGLVGEARRGALRRGTAGGCADAAGRRHRVLHGRAVHHSARRHQRNLLPARFTTSSSGATAIPRPRRSSSATTANPSGRRSRCTTSPAGPAAFPGWPPAILNEPTAALAESQRTGSPPAGVDPALWQQWHSRFQEHLDRFGHAVYNLDFASPVPADDPVRRCWRR